MKNTKHIAARLALENQILPLASQMAGQMATQEVMFAELRELLVDFEVEITPIVVGQLYRKDYSSFDMERAILNRVWQDHAV